MVDLHQRTKYGNPPGIKWLQKKIVSEQFDDLGILLTPKEMGSIMFSDDA